jgi:hypothetical protein
MYTTGRPCGTARLVAEGYWPSMCRTIRQTYIVALLISFIAAGTAPRHASQQMPPKSVFRRKRPPTHDLDAQDHATPLTGRDSLRGSPTSATTGVTFKGTHAGLALRDREAPFAPCPPCAFSPSLQDNAYTCAPRLLGAPLPHAGPREGMNAQLCLHASASKRNYLAFSQPIQNSFLNLTSCQRCNYPCIISSCPRLPPAPRSSHDHIKVSCQIASCYM